jgi:hypothetical protein
METTSNRTEFWRHHAAIPCWIALCALTTVASLAKASPPGTRLTAVVSIADGGPFTVIRGDEVSQGSKGITLTAGDMVETGPGAFLVLQLQGGSLIGIGPSSGVYLLPRAAVATLVVQKGWVKADSRAEAISVLGPRAGIRSQQAIVILHADEHSDALFDEQGPGTLLLRDTAATHISKQTKPNQFFVREQRSDAVLLPHPSPDFLATLPVAFRDSLPERTAGQLPKPLESKPLRKVTYLDIQPWLTLPPDWRTGFITRFRNRLKDPAFFAAMDAHLSLHPEWRPILHPPKPSDGVSPR